MGNPNAEGGAGGGGIQMIIMFGLIFVVMYFFMIRPQRKREQTRQKMISALQKGDKVVTNSGIIGTVWGIQDNIVVLKIDNDVKVEFLKSAISGKMEG
jgi:preprotein translocase subunit YajC